MGLVLKSNIGLFIIVSAKSVSSHFLIESGANWFHTPSLVPPFSYLVLLELNLNIFSIFTHKFTWPPTISIGSIVLFITHFHSPLFHKNISYSSSRYVLK